MSNLINFIAEDNYTYEVCRKPYPAFNTVLSQAADQVNEDEDDIVKTYNFGLNFNKITSISDSFKTGYIFPLWSDVQVRYENSIPTLHWRSRKDIFGSSNITDNGLVPPDGYLNINFKYLNPWHMRTPKGYSTLLVAPLGYENLPFKALPSVLDTDYEIIPAYVDIWIKKDFEGIVENGTPIFQAIPFKRDSWNSEFSKYSGNDFSKILDSGHSSSMIDNFIKRFWHKRQFN